MQALIPVGLMVVAVVHAGVATRPRVRRPLDDSGPMPAREDGRGVVVGHLPRRRPPARSDPDALAAWCDRLARATGSGSTLTAAFREAAPPASLADAHREAVRALDRGAGLTAALDLIEASTRDERLAVTVLRTCADHGGPAAQPLDRAAAALRERARDLADRRTQSAQARASARVMTVLPVAMLGVLVLTSETIRAQLVRPLGLGVVAAGTALNLAGRRWMFHIIREPEA